MARVQGVPQLMSHPKITRHSKTGTRLATVFLHRYPSLNVSDAASERPSMPDNRVACGTKFIPIHLFGCSKLGRHQRFSRLEPFSGVEIHMEMDMEWEWMEMGHNL